MSRLTKYGKTSHENSVCCTHFNSKECMEVVGNCAYGCKWEEAVWSKLAHYEDLEEQGRLIELPCKVGDTVYWITTHGILERYAAITEPIHSKIVELRPLGLDDEVYPFPIPTFFREFGESVFLTKEEAEAKLAELKEGGVDG